MAHNGAANKIVVQICGGLPDPPPPGILSGGMVPLTPSLN